MHIDNFEEKDYISKTEIGSCGYKVYSNANIKASKYLYLNCQLNNDFADELDYEH